MITTLLALLVGANGGSARANDSVRADTTLSNNSVVTPSTSGGKTTYTITGGTARNSGRYLFHSFQAFSLLQNEIGYFNNAPQIQTIFGRVTGGNQSNIDGLIKANGTANLFLINPKGIVFGPNARIDLGGAFKASTAKALDFNGQLFSAVNPQDAPLLTSDIVPGLQYGSSLATLKNEAVLVVKDGQEILLAGGPLDTVTSSGTLTANRGSITLSSGTTKVSGGSIQADGGNITISGSDSAHISSATISTLSTTTGSSSTPGSIAVTGGDIKIGSANGRTILRAGNAKALSSDETSAANLTLLDSAIRLTSGAGKAIVLFSGNTSNNGTTIIRTASPASANPSDPNAVSLNASINGSTPGRILVGGTLAGTPGTPTVTSQTSTIGAGTKLTADGGRIDVLSTKSSTSAGTLQADRGNITINGTQRSGITGGELTANSGTIRILGVNGSNLKDSEYGGPGSININTASLNINGGFISTSTNQQGRSAGAITIKASDSVVIINDGIINSQVSSKGVGDGGAIAIATPVLNLFNKGTISTNTFGNGDAGTIQITAANLLISGNSSNISSQVGTGGRGNSGGVAINGDSLIIRYGGSISSSTNGHGDAGAIAIKESNSVIIAANSSIMSTVANSANGNAGVVTIDTSELTIGKNGEILASTNGKGNAGAIAINVANDIAIDGGRINTKVGTNGIGNAGKIDIKASSLTITNGASIAASSLGEGDAGKIAITVSDNVALKGTNLNNESSGINTRVAAGAKGAGGDIEINTNTLTIEDGGKIIASTGGEGNAGIIKLNALGQVIISGIALLKNDNLIAGGMLNFSTAQGKAGDIILQVGNLAIDQGAEINAQTSGSGNGGVISINGQGNLKLAGGSRITARSNNGTGRAGDISINVNGLTLSDTSEIKADGGNYGQAGTININLRDKLQLDTQSSINASTPRSTTNEGGANITISLNGDLILNNGSSIIARATGKANGGNIKLSLPNGFLLSSFPSSFGGNDILASAEEGNGGRIELRALGIFGVNTNTFDTRFSEASAKSRSGRNGVLAFYIPYLTPDRGVVPIEQPLDPDNDLVRACSPRTAGQRAAFTQTGRGGLPILPGTRPSNSPLLDDLGRPALRQSRLTSSPLPNASLPAPSVTSPITSASQHQDPARTLALPLPPCPENR